MSGQLDLFRPADPEDPKVVMVYFAPSARLQTIPEGCGGDSLGGMVGERLERMGLTLVLGDYDALPKNPGAAR